MHSRRLDPRSVRPSRRAARGARLVVASCAASCLAAGGLAAQADTAARAVWRAPRVGTEEERYLRALQVAGLAPWQPWTVRPFAADPAAGSPVGDAHPWPRALRARLADTTGRALAFEPPEVRASFNSGFPFGLNDGPVWQGRGLTVSAAAGVRGRWGPLSIDLRPIAFAAQNASIALMPNGVDGDGRFADAIEPFAVDAPQRFGDHAYARVDPGQSTVSVAALGMIVGASTANEFWGPAQTDPLVLGDNAAGIPRLFVGTARPITWPLGTVHVRLEAGEMGQSRWATTSPDSSRRLMAGLVGVVTVRGVPGLEIGAGRFFHRLRGTGTLVRAFSIPFEAFFKDQLANKDSSAADNQLASVFARWTVPAARLEVYGEFGRNDHAQNVRDLLVEPDHNSAYTIGLTRVWSSGPRRVVALRVETMNSRITHLTRVRPQARWAQHTPIRQGHTQLGQLLGSAAGLGGAATTIGVDVYRPDGRWTYEVARRLRQEPVAEAATARQIDVYNVLGVERLWLRRAADLTLGASVVRELNRDFARDATNLRLTVGWRMR